MDRMIEKTSEDSKKIVKVAVRTLIEQMYRSGSLGGDFGGVERAVEGIAGHKKIQSSRPDGYSKEVSITHRLDTPFFILEISGRIDGIFETSDPIIIEELKTTNLSPDDPAIGENLLHWGQLKLYAYCYAVENGLDRIGAQLTYYHLGTEDIREHLQIFDLAELTEFFNEVAADYLVWANKMEEWRQLRDDAIQAMEFPFVGYREGQRQMAVDVYLTVKEQTQAIIQAPTGIGKTMASLFPAVKALGEGHVGKIFYLTARTTGKMAAETALVRLREKGLRCKSVTITAKEKSCFASDIYCQMDSCEFALGYYDRVDEAITAAFELDDLTREKIEQLARQYRVCPFEFSLDLSLLADCIICDYNYAFDPRVYLKRFFNDNNGDYTFLIDEAHNLVDRSRDMFSAELNKQDFLSMRKAIKDYSPMIYQQLGRINRWLTQARKECRARGEAYAEKDCPEALLPLLQKFADDTSKWLVDNRLVLFRKDLLDLYFKANWFLTVAEKFDESYATCYDNSGWDMTIKLFCLDPSSQMGESLKRTRSTVFFSATLTPADYFQRLFGCQESIKKRALTSPFPPDNLCVLLMPTISTKYNNRAATVPDVAEAIFETVNHRAGNYLLFFPSYKYMQTVYDEFIACDHDLDTLLQESFMPEEARAGFLERFSEDNERTLAGFVVMGGIFGEGIDLVGDRLTGAVVVGVGLPAICLERELIREYFEGSDGNGFEFAYLYPGMTRVLQAAGRVIRTENDKGVVLLIDERFIGSRYRSLFPKEWQPVNVSDSEQLRKVLDRFWDGETV